MLLLSSQSANIDLLSASSVSTPQWVEWAEDFQVQLNLNADVLPGQCHWKIRFCHSVSWDRTPSLEFQQRRNQFCQFAAEIRLSCAPIGWSLQHHKPTHLCSSSKIPVSFSKLGECYWRAKQGFQPFWLLRTKKKKGSPAKIPAKRQGQRLEMAFELLISMPGLPKAREKKPDS